MQGAIAVVGCNNITVTNCTFTSNQLVLFFSLLLFSLFQQILIIVDNFFLPLEAFMVQCSHVLGIVLEHRSWTSI